MNITSKDLAIENFYEDGWLKFDLRWGVIRNRAGTREVVLNSDLLQGIYAALVDEAGPAWGVILKRCGKIWGSRLAKRMDKEFSDFYRQPFHEQRLGQFAFLIQEYFRRSGWGGLDLDLTQTLQTGLILASCRNTIFGSVIKGEEEPVDFIVAGILASVFTHAAARELECYQTECISLGAPKSQFVIGVPDRLAKVPGLIRQKVSHDAIVAQI